MAKRQQQRAALTDELIRDQALRLASVCDYSEQEKIKNPNWLGEFKKKYNIPVVVSCRVPGVESQSETPPDVDTSVDPVDHNSSASPLSSTQVQVESQKETTRGLSSSVLNDNDCWSDPGSTWSSTLMSDDPFITSSLSSMSAPAIDPTLISADESINQLPRECASQPPFWPGPVALGVPSCPTQDEARQALELALRHFQRSPEGLAVGEYITLGRIMDRLSSHATSKPTQ